MDVYSLTVDEELIYNLEKIERRATADMEQTTCRTAGLDRTLTRNAALGLLHSAKQVRPQNSRRRWARPCPPTHRAFQNRGAADKKPTTHLPAFLNYIKSE